MKKVLIFLFALLSFISPAGASAQDTGWVINDFSSQIYLHQDTSVDVIEKIVVDFRTLEKHGIYRDIPVVYEDRFGNKLDIRFTLGWVSEDGDIPETIATERVGDNMRVKLGSENATKSGIHTYTISYHVNRVITTPENYAEFYWNATGFDWEVPIGSAYVEVNAPEGSLTDSICFRGVYGAVDEDCLIANSATTTTFTTSDLSPGENLTISVKLDPASFSFPSHQQEIYWFIEDNWTYLLPILVLLLMLNKYWQKGRDLIYSDTFHESDLRTKKKPLFYRSTPSLLFGPLKNVPAGVVGTIADEHVHTRDLTATIIDLARRGFITIEEEKKKLFKKTNYIFTYNKQSEENLAEYETLLLDTFFGPSRNNNPASLDKLPKSSYTHFDAASKSLYKYVTDNGYFSANPQSTRNKYIVASIIIIVFGITFLTPLSTRIGLPITLSGLVIFPFSFFMPARTAKGSKVLRDIAGLREWIRIGAWREQIHEKHNLLEEVLPYTIAFGLTYKFIKALSDSDLKNLDWYKSSGPLNVYSFSNSLNSLGYHTTSSVNATRPKSSSSGGSSFSGGGGFSGGGFGGGGGGSW